MKLDKVYSWIKSAFTPIKTTNYTYGSYSLKHMLQNETGIYITEEEFQEAMKHCGFEPQKEHCGHHYYGISKRSPALLRTNLPYSSKSK